MTAAHSSFSQKTSASARPPPELSTPICRCSTPRVSVGDWDTTGSGMGSGLTQLVLLFSRALQKAHAGQLQPVLLSPMGAEQPLLHQQLHPQRPRFLQLRQRALPGDAGGTPMLVSGPKPHPYPSLTHNSHRSPSFEPPPRPKPPHNADCKPDSGPKLSDDPNLNPSPNPNLHPVIALTS